MRRGNVAAFFLLGLLTISGAVFIEAAAIDRYLQSVDVQSTFAWTTTFSLPKGQLGMNLDIPLRITAQGLPNKVTPGENFQISTAVGLQTGALFSIGGHQFDLDPIVQFAAPYIPTTFDVSTFAADATCAIASVTITPAGAALACSVSTTFKKLIELDLQSQLVINGRVTGPGSLTNPSLQTWLLKSGTMSLTINTDASRGDQLALQLDPSWSVNLFFDFRPDIYNDPLYGWVFKDMRDALHLPWQPVLGISYGNSSPQMRSIVLVPDFQLMFSTQDVSISNGQSSSVELTASAIDEYDGLIALNIVQAPQGIQGALSSSQLSPQSSTLVTLSASNLPQGDYQLGVSGTGGGKSHTVYLTIHVQTQSPNNNQGSPTAPNGGQVASIMLFFGIVLALIVGIATVLLRRTAQPATTQPVELIGNQAIPLSQMPSQLWFCRYCGHDIEFNSRFCSYCGRDLA